MKLLFTLFSVCALGFSSLGQVDVLKSYSTEEFSIDYPMDWELDKDGEMGTEVIVYAPLTEFETEFRANVNYLIQDVGAFNLSLDELVTLSEQQVNEIIPEGVLINSKRTKTDSGEYHTMEFSGTTNNINLQFVQRYFLEDGLAHVITYTAKEKNEAGIKVLNSFKLK